MRQSVVLLLGALLAHSRVGKDAVVDAVETHVMHSINSNVGTSEVERLIMHPGSRAVAVHETMGWKSLETSIAA